MVSSDLDSSDSLLGLGDLSLEVGEDLAVFMNDDVWSRRITSNGCKYPGHVRPVRVHARQCGRVSSHLNSLASALPVHAGLVRCVP
jgi:hypothetical protein